MKGDKDKWVKRKDGSSHNIAIGSNCNCWMCTAVTKWVSAHHWTKGRERQKFADDLITYLCYRMGYSGCEDVTTLKQTLGRKILN